MKFGTSLVFISEHFEDNLHWLYSAASEDEVYYNDQMQLLADKKSNKPYSGLVRTLHNGIFTISEYDNGLKDGTEYIYTLPLTVANCDKFMIMFK